MMSILMNRHQKRVDVKDIMDGKVGFNDAMSDKNTVLHFS